MTEAEKKVKDEVAKMDLYAILGVSHEASEKQIVKSYRKLALKYHPDKNPDSPSAVEMFHELSKALEILTDKAAKAVYDKIQKAKRAAELRLYELDSKRRKLREDLESREKLAETKSAGGGVHNSISDQAKLEAEIKRLRKEGSRLLQEEQERLKEELKKNETKDDDVDDLSPPRLKVKWKAKKGDPENGGYNRPMLLDTFNKYGDVAALIVSASKVGSAVVEFTDSNGAQLACDHETGLTNNPLKLTWISGQPTARSKQTNESYTTPRPWKNDNETSYHSNTTSSNLVSGFSFNSSNNQTVSSSSGKNGSGETEDFESLVFMRMRQAQERKRLAEELAVDDKEDGENSLVDKQGEDKGNEDKVIETEEKDD